MSQHKRAIERAHVAEAVKSSRAYTGPFTYEFDSHDDDNHKLVAFGDENGDDFPHVDDDAIHRQSLGSLLSTTISPTLALGLVD